MRYVVIMAGGSGKRLWPLSRQGMPKQMLHLVGDTSLLRLAFERVVDVVGAEQVWVCTGSDYTDTVHAELPELPRRNILGEPVGRDSLNAIAWPATNFPPVSPLSRDNVALGGSFGVTVSVAGSEVAIPYGLETTTRKRSPSSAGWASARTRVAAVAPPMSAQSDVPASARCH